jgi:hypothetical protein
LSGWHVEFVGSPAHQALGDELEAAGLVYANTTTPLGVFTDAGEATVLSTDLDANVRQFNRISAGAGDLYRSDADAFAANTALIAAVLGEEPNLLPFVGDAARAIARAPVQSARSADSRFQPAKAQPVPIGSDRLPDGSVGLATGRGRRGVGRPRPTVAEPPHRERLPGAEVAQNSSTRWSQSSAVTGDWSFWGALQRR